MKEEEYFRKRKQGVNKSMVGKELLEKNRQGDN
jgi:hypothetical protein